MIKKKISEHKKKLIREFERCITKMEEDIIHIIVRSDEEFIDCLEAIDDKIIGFERKL